MFLASLKRCVLTSANPFSRNIVFILLLSFIGIVFLPVAKGQAFKRIHEGEQYFDFNLFDINGNKTKMESIIGQNKATGIIFWSSGSLRSKDELKVLQDLYKKYKNIGIGFVAVYAPHDDKGIKDEELVEISEVIADLEITFPVLLDDGLAVYTKYGVITVPSLAIVGSDGKILSILPGFPKFSGDKLIKRAFEKALGIEIIPKRRIAKGYKPKGKAHFYYNFAQKMFKKGFMGKAKSKLQKALKEDNNYAPAHSLLGRVFANQKNMDSATDSFITSLDLDSSNIESHYYYAIVCRDGNRISESINEFNESLKYAPKDPSINYGLGTAYLKNGEDEKAKAKFLESIQNFEGKEKSLFNGKVTSDIGDVHYDLANIYLKENKPDEAISELKKANRNYKTLVKSIKKSH